MDPTRRFDPRAEDYDVGRPSYPRVVVDALRGAIGLRPEHVVADVGAGTGLSSAPFVEHGNVVIAVEPSPAMGEAAKRRFRHSLRFSVVRARAEATALQSSSVDLVMAGQAFHWFDPRAFSDEVRRILKPGGALLLFWNLRRRHGSPFLEAFERFLCEWGTEYAEVSERWAEPGSMRTAFGGLLPAPIVLDNQQHLDLRGLLARITSSSYMPGRGHPRYEAMLEAAGALFEAHAEEGKVTLEYDLELYAGRPGG